MTTIPLFEFLNATVLDASGKWNHAVFVHDWLVSLSVMSSSFVLVVIYFLKLRNIPLYMHSPFLLCIHLEMDFRVASRIVFFLSANQSSLIGLPRFLNAHSSY